MQLTLFSSRALAFSLLTLDLFLTLAFAVAVRLRRCCSPRPPPCSLSEIAISLSLLGLVHLHAFFCSRSPCCSGGSTARPPWALARAPPLRTPANTHGRERSTAR